MAGIGRGPDIQLQTVVAVTVPAQHVEIEDRDDVVAGGLRRLGIPLAAEQTLLFAGEDDEPQSPLERTRRHDFGGGEHGDGTAGIVVGARRIADRRHVVDVRAYDDDLRRRSGTGPVSDDVAIDPAAIGPRVVAGLQSQRGETLMGQGRRALERDARILVPRADVGEAAAGEHGLDARQPAQVLFQIGLRDLRHHGRHCGIAGDGDPAVDIGPGARRGQSEIQRRRRQEPALESPFG